MILAGTHSILVVSADDPIKMKLPEEMRVSDLHNSRLVLLNTTETGIEEMDVFTGKEVLTQNPGAVGTLVFVVRRPG